MNKSKDQKHKEKMIQKRIDKAREKMCDSAVELMLVLTYTVLHQQFGFEMDKLNELRRTMDRYATYMRDGVLNSDDMRDVLLKNGVDISKIGGCNIE